MRISGISVPLLVALASPILWSFQARAPMMASIEPASGKVGDVFIIEGENLDNGSVSALYLTDGTIDIKVPILEQTGTSIKFRIPLDVKPGRLALMVLTKEKPPRLIEEPVKITIEPETISSTSAQPANRPAFSWAIRSGEQIPFSTVPRRR
jgi:hypothetical protein